MTRKIQKQALLFALALGLGACGASKGGDPNEGNAQLSIVGDSNVFLDYGTVQTLTIRYHTNDDQPLAGQVNFEIKGTAPGASISKTFGVTDAEGIVQLQLTGTNTDATFQIEATADYAAPVAWTIAVSDGAVPNLDPTGRYALDSKFDIVSSLDNDVGNVLNTFIDMTDDEHDPATWLLDQLVAQAPSGAQGAIDLARNVFNLDEKLNTEIMNRSPGFVTDILALGEMTGDVARNFGVNSELDIRSAGQNDVDSPDYSASHIVTGANFLIQGQTYNFTVADMDIVPIRAEGISVSTNDKNDLVFSQHALPLSYGSMIIIAMQEAIIPLIDSSATNLESFLLNQVDCESVGQDIFDETNFGDADLYEGLCQAGVALAAAAAIDQLQGIDDDGVVLDILGEARPRDTNGDRKVDQLASGTWQGAIDYAGSPAALDAALNTFTGTRMGN